MSDDFVGMEGLPPPEPDPYKMRQEGLTPRNGAFDEGFAPVARPIRQGDEFQVGAVRVRIIMYGGKLIADLQGGSADEAINAVQYMIKEGMMTREKK